MPEDRIAIVPSVALWRRIGSLRLMRVAVLLALWAGVAAVCLAGFGVLPGVGSTVPILLGLAIVGFALCTGSRRPRPLRAGHEQRRGAKIRGALAVTSMLAFSILAAGTVAVLGGATEACQTRKPATFDPVAITWAVDPLHGQVQCLYRTGANDAIRVSTERFEVVYLVSPWARNH